MTGIDLNLNAILLGCLGILILRLITRLEKGNETLATVSKDVAVILVELKAYGVRIAKNEEDISAIRERHHTLGNLLNENNLHMMTLNEKITELKPKIGE